jgi:RNA polymerase sigma-70 factor (ECF subfamily)
VGLDVEAAYVHHGPMVLRRCRKLLGDEQRAVEVMHDVFLEVHDRRHRLDDRGLSSFLFQLATHRCLNQLRSRRRRPEDADGTLVDRIASAPDPEARGLARVLLDRLLGDAPPSTRVLAVLHLLDGLTLEEVAKEVGLSVSGVRLRLRTLRDRLPELSEV